MGIGLSMAEFPASAENLLDALKEKGDVYNFAFNFDLLGIYFYLSDKMLVGVIVNGVTDRYWVDNNSWIRISQTSGNASGIDFTGESFGSGLFFRTDLGISFLGSSSGIADPGVGIHLGTGWAFDLGGTRLLLNLNYARRSFTSIAFSGYSESNTLNTFSISVGGLF